MPSTSYRSRRSDPPRSRRQRGATLYVALMMLILLALIGVAALQVTALQERMSSNYRATQSALENAESVTRGRENDIKKQVDSGGMESVITDTAFCQQAFSPENWAEGKDFASPPSGGQVSHARRIDPCISGYGSAKLGEAETRDPNPMFQITAYATDRASDATADAVIDTIFIP